MWIKRSTLKKAVDEFISMTAGEFTTEDVQSFISERYSTQPSCCECAYLIRSSSKVEKVETVRRRAIWKRCEA